MNSRIAATSPSDTGITEFVDDVNELVDIGKSMNPPEAHGKGEPFMIMEDWPPGRLSHNS